MAEARHALVLGGGGVSGIAWQIGILAGVEAEGVHLVPAASLVATSAGATVAAQITSGASLSELYERQRAGVPHEVAKGFGRGDLLRFVLAQALPGSEEQVSRRVGALARRASTGPQAQRREIVEARLPSRQWPDAELSIVVVDAVTGRTRLVTKSDGLDLVDVVAASSAVPTVWPPVALGPDVYIDGGTRSVLNLDLAGGVGPVIALAPTTVALNRRSRVSQQRDRLGAERPVHVVTMSPEGKAGQGRNPLDPSVVPAVAREGREQGRREAVRIARLLAVPH